MSRQTLGIGRAFQTWLPHLGFPLTTFASHHSPLPSTVQENSRGDSCSSDHQMISKLHPGFNSTFEQPPHSVHLLALLLVFHAQQIAQPSQQVCQWQIVCGFYGLAETHDVQILLMVLILDPRVLWAATLCASAQGCMKARPLVIRSSKN